MYSSSGSQDIKTLVWERRDLPNRKILKKECIGNRLTVLLFLKIYFQRQLNWNDRYFRIRKRNLLAHTHTHTHTHKLTRGHTHTNIHTQFRFFLSIVGALSIDHLWIWFPPGFVVSIVMLCTLSTVMHS